VIEFRVFGVPAEHSRVRRGTLLESRASLPEKGPACAGTDDAEGRRVDRRTTGTRKRGERFL
jgi:hypothetical protein